jgi:DNA-binding SARP family transcriptional activator
MLSVSAAASPTDDGALIPSRRSTMREIWFRRGSHRPPGRSGGQRLPHGAPGDPGYPPWNEVRGTTVVGRTLWPYRPSRDEVSVPWVRRRSGMEGSGPMRQTDPMGEGGSCRDTPLIRIRMLGALRVQRADGTEVGAGEFRTSKTRHLLRLMALQQGEPIRVESLVDVLWPTVPPERGRASLRTAASQLRRTLAADHVARVGEGLILHGAEVDTWRFQREGELALQCFAHRDLEVGLHHARAALARYQGDLADDEPYLDPIQRAREQLAARYEQLLLEGATAALRLGYLQEAVELAEQALQRDACCERACRTLMRAFVGLSERAMALRVYDRCRRAMAAELGVGPAGETRALYQQLLIDADVPVTSLVARVA